MIERLTDEFEILNILYADNKKEQYPHEHYSYNKHKSTKIKFISYRIYSYLSWQSLID